MTEYIPKGSASSESYRIAYQDEVFGQLNRLIELANSQHGRVLALSMASFAEECLGRLLKTFLREVKASDELLEGFNAPLGTFAARIKLCYAMGIITDYRFKDLELARKVRNEFAHTWDACTFSDEKIKRWVDALSPVQIQHLNINSHEDKFRAVMFETLFETERLQHNIQEKNKRLPSIAVGL